jgi:hypothetical protein
VPLEPEELVAAAGFVDESLVADELPESDVESDAPTAAGFLASVLASLRLSVR